MEIKKVFKKILGIQSPSKPSKNLSGIYTECEAFKNGFNRSIHNDNIDAMSYVKGYENGKRVGKREAILKKYTPNQLRELLGLKVIDCEIHSPSKQLINIWEDALPYFYKGVEHGMKEVKKMTCREKLKIEHPEKIDKWYTGGCYGCPHSYGYAKELIYCDENDETCAQCWDREVEEPDVVNHPSHYETGKYECIDVMAEALGKEAVKDFCLCNAFKYIYRHKRKNGLEDIKKAQYYINKYVEMEESEND